MPASDHRRTPLLPATVAGLALLLVGLTLLLVGGLRSAANGTEVDLWFVGVGLLVLLGALLATFLTDPVPRPSEPPPSTAVAANPSGPAESKVPAPRRAGSGDDSPSEWLPSPSRATTRFSVSSSIAAQFEGPPHAAAAEEMGFAPWDEGAGSGMSLPFAAVWPPDDGPSARSGPVEDDLSYASLESLEHEVERLREKVLALQYPEFGHPSSPESPAVRSSMASVAGPRPPEPPSPDAAAPRRACTGCGTGLPGGATDPLCWGCGRPLCATCYWRTREGGGAHTCPACFARASGTTVSSGRGPMTSVTRAASDRVRAATSSR